jgi:hypothetical protein
MPVTGIETLNFLPIVYSPNPFLPPIPDFALRLRPSSCHTLNSAKIWAFRLNISIKNHVESSKINNGAMSLLWKNPRKKTAINFLIYLYDKIFPQRNAPHRTKNLTCGNVTYYLFAVPKWSKKRKFTVPIPIRNHVEWYELSNGAIFFNEK